METRDEQGRAIESAVSKSLVMVAPPVHYCSKAKRKRKKRVCVGHEDILEYGWTGGHTKSGQLVACQLEQTAAEMNECLGQRRRRQIRCK